MIIDQGGWAAPWSVYLAPPRRLEGLVVEGWVQRYPDGGASGPWRIVPDLQPHLLLKAGRDGGIRGPRLVGPRSTWVDRPARGRIWTAGVTLRPGALPLLTAHPATDFLDRAFDVGEIVGKSGRELRRKVAAASTPEAAVGLLFTFLARRVDGARRPVDWRVEGARRPVDWRVEGLLARSSERRRPGVAELAGEMGLSGRNLRETWSREVGLSPRSALSIRRLHRAVRMALTHPAETGARVAVRAGYHDQPHMVRDFRRWLGEAPTEFLARGRRAAG